MKKHTLVAMLALVACDPTERVKVKIIKSPQCGDYQHPCPPPAPQPQPDPPSGPTECPKDPNWPCPVD